MRDEVDTIDKMKDLRELLTKYLGKEFAARKGEYNLIEPMTKTLNLRTFLREIYKREMEIRSSRGVAESKGSGIRDRMRVRYGRSTLLKPRARRIVGMGIGRNDTTYEKFGRYMLYIPALKKNILHLKFPSFVSIPSLPRTEISDDLKDFIEDVVENKKINKRMYDRLSKDDRTYFNKVASKAQIDDVLDITDEVSKQERDEIKRFELVKGIIQAGNNNPEVLGELREFLMKFSREGKLHPHKVNDILYELMAIS